MACTFTDISSFQDFIVWPTGCFYYFWLFILFSVWGIVVWALIKKEEERLAVSEALSSCAIASIAVLIIAIFGSLVTNTAGIAMIQSDILTYFVAWAVVWVLIWVFKREQ